MTKRVRPQIYIGDPTYDRNYSSLEKAQTATDAFKEKIERKYGVGFKNVDLGRGASWPTLFTTLDLELSLLALLATFLNGAEIVDAWDTWK
jgi:hypothetical protein